MNADEKKVINYYNTGESKRGYILFLKGTKHFGYYTKEDKPWQFQKALRQMESRLAKELKLSENAKILDAGCGMGDVACFLAKRYKYRIEGIDILDFNIREAKKRIKRSGLGKLVHVQEMSYYNLRFPKNSFDGIYTMETFVHASDPDRTLKEFYKVLKPGGKIVMFEYSRDSDIQMSKRASQAFKTINEFAAMPAFQQFNHGIQEKLMKKAGFTNINVADISSRVAPMLKMFYYMAFIPYTFVSILNQQEKFVNMMSAVEFWRYRKHIRYNIYSAYKPEE
jgi:sterol 24-C-methyltransferase